MKWQPVKKINALIFLCILLTVAVAFGKGSLSGGARSASLPLADMEGTFQLGFYDLMSQTKEIYNAQMKATKGSILATLTNPDDNRFVLKEKFTPTAEKKGRLYFNLMPIYHTTTHEGLMIDGLVDMLMHANFWMAPLTLDGQRLVVGQSGMIVLYPLQP
ncbi:hypothetical protein [Intestinirhabdus alba]|jgi:hypothetical protein|uniref:Uncharacterized protein n=1 Tax=Intestinirhabdus alba TaxID=2899544 RepID=A0A6L6IJ65_9ENTR|nr:hypothetical protein [Intestinirhabdus alba]MTH46175.1 hypothetical protein [Intestinirhabdus alba]